MHRFTFKTTSCDLEEHDRWTAEGKGETFREAFEALCVDLQRFDIYTTDEYGPVESEELLMVALYAVATPGVAIEQKCFGTPEDNYELTYFDGKIRPSGSEVEQFGERVLSMLESTPEWGTGLLDEISGAAQDLGVAHLAADGYFRAGAKEEGSES